MPKRIQRKRTKGWHMPENTVYVGRPTIWGNPFVCDEPQRVVDAFRLLISGGTKTFSINGPEGLRFASNANRNTLHHDYAGYVRKYIHELRGKDLACWCKEGAPCHADVLLEIANG